MKNIHLLRTAEAPEALGDLWTALASLGLRFGWLDLDDESLPEDELGRAARGGALRAVRIGADGSTVRKTRRGPVVLGDLLREHFVGCTVVVARGESASGFSDSRWVAAPRLGRIDADRLRLEGEHGVLELTPGELAQRLRRPRGV